MAPKLRRASFVSCLTEDLTPKATDRLEDPQESVRMRTAVSQPATHERRQMRKQLPASLGAHSVAAGLLPLLAAIVVCLALGLLVADFAVFAGCGLTQPCVPLHPLEVGEEPFEISQQDRATFLLYLFGTVLTCPGTAWLLAGARTSTPYFKILASYTFLVWLSIWGFTCKRMVLCGGGLEDVIGSATSASQALISVIVLLQLLVFGELVHGRLRALEVSAMQPLGVRPVVLMLPLAVLAYGAELAYLALSGAGLGREAGLDHSIAMSIVSWACLVFYPAACLLAIRAVVITRRLALKVVVSACGRRAVEASMAAKTLRVHMLGVAAGMATAWAQLLFLFSHRGALRPLASPGSLGDRRLPDSVPFIVDFACVFVALSVSGALSGALGASQTAAISERLRRERWTVSSAGWRREVQAAESSQEDSAWHEKVEELAGRGFTLQALLRFYRGLGSEYMPHYCPSRHTTTDVVRAAVIPLSSRQRSAYATIMMQGQYTRPKRMVTHNWSNLFRDVVAAIIADALEEDEYAMISLLLERDIDKLERWVDARGTGLRTYWVCAFSVNQHCSICGGNPQRSRDTVTGLLHPVCACGLAKAWNSTEPLRRGGGSIPCEMNKFNDMMRFLSATDPDFEQIVAVDAAFVLFSRAWCVAELAEASAAGMVQHLKLESADSLVHHGTRLRRLRIRDMEATRPEDKEEILKSIADVDAFDEHLQRLLFQDLLPAWQSLDVTEQIVRIGRIARWQSACEARGNPHLWKAGLADASTPQFSSAPSGRWKLAARTTRCWIAEEDGDIPDK